MAESMVSWLSFLEGQNCSEVKKRNGGLSDFLY